MTIAIARRETATFDCGGAQIRAHCRHLATVVSVRGEIDGLNADAVAQHLQRFILGDGSLVLDLIDVSRFAAAGISVLQGFDEECRIVGVEWTLVASPSVIAMLDDDFPVAHSVREALRDVADAIVSRRQLVLPLIKKTA